MPIPERKRKNKIAVRGEFHLGDWCRYGAETDVELVIFCPPLASVVIAHSYLFLVRFSRPLFIQRNTSTKI